VTTEAAYIREDGKGFGCEFSATRDELVPGFTQVARAIKTYGSVAATQAYHGGYRLSRGG